MKKFLNSLNDKAKSFNVFSSPVNLRHELDPEYNTTAGGYITIGLFILLSVLFYSQWLSLIHKDQIKTTTQVIRQTDPQSFIINNADFMFAVGISGINMSDTITPRYFDFYMEEIVSINGTSTKTNMTLQQCSEQHWEQLGSVFVETYNRWKLSAFLCPQKNRTMTISGKYTSQVFAYYKISIGKCTGSNCKTTAQLNSYIASRTSFSFNFYYSNSLLNPDLTTPVTMFFQDKDYLQFSNAHGSMMNLYLSQYIMQTDQNLMPWKNQVTRSGFILNRDQKEVYDYIPQANDAFCRVYIRKSNIKYELSRSFLKIDQVLSYIGGLFGIIAVFVGFIMNYYGQCSFELQMSEHIFQFDKTRKEQKEQNQQHDQKFDLQNHETEQKKKQQVLTPRQFGFLDFIVHLVYSHVKLICPSIRWERMELYQESLKEIRNKLQVSHLLEKMSFYDRAFNVLFDQHQLKLLYLQQKLDFEQVRNERTMLNLKAVLIANAFGLTQQIEQQDIKKTLDQKSKQKSTKRMKTFIGRSVTFVEELLKVDKNETQKLPPDIVKALQKLQKKIEQGDKVSTRIYNGLKYQFLQAYENGKKRGKTGKKRRIQIKQEKQESHRDLVFQSSLKNFLGLE